MLMHIKLCDVKAVIERLEKQLPKGKQKIGFRQCWFAPVLNLGYFPRLDNYLYMEVMIMPKFLDKEHKEFYEKKLKNYIT